jgi:uridine phosphorylase
MEKIPIAALSLVEGCVASMPARLRPTAPIAPDAILVGDPGRALLLAQKLLGKPKMSNHARGLWGYSGQTAGGEELTIQATGMGGPSAALVLADLAKLGVRRAVRVGTATALDAETRLGESLLATAAVAVGGSATSFGVEAGASVLPDPTLLERLRAELPEARPAPIASLDTLPAERGAPPGLAAADMQTLAVLARGRELGIAVAAVLVVAERGGDGRLDEGELEAAAIKAGEAAARALSNPQVEG